MTDFLKISLLSIFIVGSTFWVSSEIAEREQTLEYGYQRQEQLIKLELVRTQAMQRDAIRFARLVGLANSR